MPKLKEIIEFLDRYLEIDNDYNDVMLNGVQILIDENDNVHKIGFSCDANMRSIKKAVKENCDLLITHHPIFKKETKRFRLANDLQSKRIVEAIKGNLSIYSVHLPLDFHSEVGNNVSLANFLFSSFTSKIVKAEDFSFVVCDVDFKNMDEFLKYIMEKIKVNGIEVYGEIQNEIKKVAIFTGGSSSLLEECLALTNFDVFLCGEMKHAFSWHPEELKTCVVCIGHYYSELHGLKSLMQVLANNFKDIRTCFIDEPPLKKVIA